MKCITLFFSFCLIAIFSIAQPNYDFSKLKRERLGRGVIAIRLLWLFPGVICLPTR